EINKIFLERISEAANTYQNELNNGKFLNKAVITVPEYLMSGVIPHPLIFSDIEAAKLANIEIIDIIEETHADMLYYLSNEKYSKKIKPETKIAIFDIGGGTCVCKIYEISEHEGRMYATCVIESHSSRFRNDEYSGR